MLHQIFPTKVKKLLETIIIKLFCNLIKVFQACTHFGDKVKKSQLRTFFNNSFIGVRPNWGQSGSI